MNRFLSLNGHFPQPVEIRYIDISLYSLCVICWSNCINNLLFFRVIGYMWFVVPLGWRAKQDFMFQVEGRSLTGVTSLKSQYAGIHYSGTLRIQSQTPNVLFMKVSYSKTFCITNLSDGLSEGLM